MAAMRKALLSLTPLVVGVAVAAWPPNPFDYCQLQILYWDKQETKVRDRGYIAVDEETGRTFKTGEWITWFENGAMLSRGEFRDNERHGPWTFWFQSRKKRAQLTYEEGRPVGLSTSWHPNGQKSEERFYSEGEQRAVRWYENGQKANEGVLRGADDRPLMHGLWTSWYENGQKRSEATFADGKLNGVQTLWDEQGAVTERTTWKNGEQVK